MRLLVTRPAADATALAEVLEAAGHTVICEPLLEIRPVPDVTLALEGVAALLVTSANGARALAATTPCRGLPVFAVGDSTAAAAEAAGFTTVESAGEDAAALVRLVRDRHRPAEGALLHAAGADRAGDIEKALAASGYDIRTSVLYEAVAAEILSPSLQQALAAGSLDGVLLFSPRSAAIFATLVARAGLAMAAARLVAYCLSPAVAAALAPLALRAVRVAAAPRRDALIATLSEPA